MGRPLKELKLTDEQIAQLAEIGCTTEEIALLAGCSRDTLERRYIDVLQSGRANQKVRLRRTMMQEAMAGNTAILIWLSKQMLGMREHVEQTVHTESKIFIDIGDNKA